MLVSILKLSKEFVFIEEKLLVERTENRFVSIHPHYACFLDIFISLSKHDSGVEHGRFRSDDLSDHCSQIILQVVALIKSGYGMNK